MGLLKKGIAALITLIVFAALAPIYNEVVTIVLGGTSDTVSQFLVQLVFPVLIAMLIFALVDNSPSADYSLW